MDVLFLAKKLLEEIVIQIKKAENIERLNSGQVMQEIQDLKNDLLKNKEITQQIIVGINGAAVINLEKVKKLEGEVEMLKEKIKILEENDDDQQTRVARLEKELFGKDGQIAKLNERLERHEIRLRQIEDALQQQEI